MKGFTKSAIFFLIGAIMSASPLAYSQDLTLDNITAKDYEDIVSDFTGLYTHTSVSGASSLGSVFGFEVGLVAGFGYADRIEKIVKREDSTADDLPPLPSGGLLGRLSVPFGITGEALIIPEVGTDDFKFQNMSAALMWTPTETILSFLPMSLAVKGTYTKTDIAMKIPDVGAPGTNVDANFSNTIMSLQLLASMDLMIVEPYIGLGYVTGDGTLKYKGTGNIFDTTYTTSDSATKKVDSTQFLLGAELSLLFFKFGAEYSRQLDVDRFSLKFAGGF